MRGVKTAKDVANDRHLERQQALLEMLVGGERMRRAIEQLAVDDWPECLAMARQQRLAPLLHWRLVQERLIAAIPQCAADALAQEFRRFTLRALSLQRDMAFVRQSLMEVGIEGVFLKGAFLAYHAYPQSALRPLRDIDIWVPEERALEALDALLKAGARWKDEQQEGGQHLMGVHKHFPPLMAPSSGTMIELHTRLAMPAESLDDSVPSWDGSAGLLQRLIRRSMPGGIFAYLSPTDQLLHLLVHAVYDHRLNNGPLVLTDIAFLLGKETIDWPLFWQLAGEGEWSAGCNFLLSLADYFHGPLPMPALALAPSALFSDQLMTATVLMLGDFDHRADVKLGVDLLEFGTLTKRLNSFLSRLFSSRELIGERRRASGSLLRLGAAYLAHWRRLLTVRLPQYWLNRRDGRFRRETSAQARLLGWTRAGLKGRIG